MDGLVAVIARLQAAGIVGELWIDGSLLTEKIDPDDSDVVLRVSGEFYDSATPSQRGVLDWWEGDLKKEYRCHSSMFFEWSESHPLYSVGLWNRSYWIRQWGFSRGEDYKGIAVIELRGGTS